MQRSDSQLPKLMTEGLASNAGYDFAGRFFDGRPRCLHPIHTIWFVFSWLDFLWTLLRLVDKKQMEILIDTMVSYITSQAARLDDLRLQLFLRWLKSHSSAVRNGESNPVEVQSQNKENRRGCLQKSLKLWLKALPLSGLIWEYQLVLAEIRWWRDLDETRLTKIALDCLENCS